jgi:hypothetical protein
LDGLPCPVKLRSYEDNARAWSEDLAESADRIATGEALNSNKRKKKLNFKSDEQALGKDQDDTARMYTYGVQVPQTTVPQIPSTAPTCFPRLFLAVYSTLQRKGKR